MIKAIKLADGWIICGKCGHKLARTNGNGTAGWSFKCPSCKEINGYEEQGAHCSKPMTNRQWLESLNDEEFADVINKHDACVDCKKFCKKSEWEECNIMKCDKSFVIWLKAEHNDIRGKK